MSANERARVCADKRKTEQNAARQLARWRLPVGGATSECPCLTEDKIFPYQENIGAEYLAVSCHRAELLTALTLPPWPSATHVRQLRYGKIYLQRFYCLRTR